MVDVDLVERRLFVQSKVQVWCQKENVRMLSVSLSAGAQSSPLLVSRVCVVAATLIVGAVDDVVERVHGCLTDTHRPFLPLRGKVLSV